MCWRGCDSEEGGERWRWKNFTLGLDQSRRGEVVSVNRCRLCER